MVPSGKFCAREHLRCTPRLWGTQNGAEQGPVLYVVTLLLWLTLVLRRRCPPAVVGLRRAGDVPGDATALATLQGDLRAWRRREIIGRSLDLAGAGRTAQR